MHRRELLAGVATAVIGTMGDGDIAADMVRDIMAERSRLLTTTQTSHATDKAIGTLISRQTPCLASLHKWMRAGNPTLRVNAAGILAKTGARESANEVAGHLRSDADSRQLYLTAVVARVLKMPWADAGHLAHLPIFDEAQISTLAAEVGNHYDAGARWCSVYLLGRSKLEHPEIVDGVLRQALSTEVSREMLRHIGYALAGLDPIVHKGA